MDKHRYTGDFLADGDYSDDVFVQTLSHMRPRADRTFQQNLEQTLMAQLRMQSRASVRVNPPASLLRRAARLISLTPVTWGASLAVLALALAGFLFVNLNQSPEQRSLRTPAAEDEPPLALVVAAQDIKAGTVITSSMLGVISLSAADLEKFGVTASGDAFIQDPDVIIGQTAAVDIGLLQPLQMNMLSDPCTANAASCRPIPDGYYTISFPASPETTAGFEIGDRVDVLAVVEDQIRVLAAGVLLADIQPEAVTLGAPSWQLATLIDLSHREATYALRPHTGQTPAERDDTLVEYEFTAPEPLPADYRFDLIVNVPIEQAHQLVALPAPIDDLPFTSNGDTLRFWFKQLEVVNITGGTEVTIRLPASDAANLDYLIGLGMELSFVPDEAGLR